MIIEDKGLKHEESEALVDVVNAGVGTNDLLELTSENTLRRQVGSDSGTDSGLGPLALGDLKTDQTFQDMKNDHIKVFYGSNSSQLYP